MWNHIFFKVVGVSAFCVLFSSACFAQTSTAQNSTATGSSTTADAKKGDGEEKKDGATGAAPASVTDFSRWMYAATPDKAAQRTQLQHLQASLVAANHACSFF